MSSAGARRTAHDSCLLLQREMKTVIMSGWRCIVSQNHILQWCDSQRKHWTYNTAYKEFDSETTSAAKHCESFRALTTSVQQCISWGCTHHFLSCHFLPLTTERNQEMCVSTEINKRPHRYRGPKNWLFSKVFAIVCAIYYDIQSDNCFYTTCISV